MRREIDWGRAVPVAGRLSLKWGKRKTAYTVEVMAVDFRYESLGPCLTVALANGEQRRFYESKLSDVVDLETGQAVASLFAWAEERVGPNPPLLPDPADHGLTVGLIYRQRLGRSGARDTAYVVRPKEVYFDADDRCVYIGGGSLTEESAHGQLNWKRKFDDPARFVSFYDRDTGEVIDDLRAWLTERADQAGEKIFGINR